MKRIWSLCGSFCEWSFHSFIWESVTFIFFRHIHTFEICEWKIHVKANFYQWFFFMMRIFFVKILKFLPYLWIIHIFIELIIKSITLMNEYQINDHSCEISIKRIFFRWIKMLHFHSSELPFFFHSSIFIAWNWMMAVLTCDTLASLLFFVSTFVIAFVA